jgi:phage FluMu protein Com
MCNANAVMTKENKLQVLAIRNGYLQLKCPTLKIVADRWLLQIKKYRG